ncbi:aminomethyltransferase [Paramyrothecium foliicola]|nr:aminomethyltransferase [Paramyrothecium foliicola]
MSVSRMVAGAARPLRSSFPSRLLHARPSSAAAIAPKLSYGDRRSASDLSTAELKKTPLYDLHIANGAKMVPFAGYHMPVLYATQSLTESHAFTRTAASLFDVSHMVQHIFKGPAAAAFLEKVTPSDWSGQGHMQSKLTTFLWEGTGGIVDDSVVTRLGEDEYYVVTNGACLDKDTEYFDKELGKFGGDVHWTRLDHSGLVALQGPRSAEVLKKVLANDVNLDALYFGNAAWAELKLPDGSKTHPVLVSRGGYTGEDGFELSFNGKLYPALETTVSATESLLTAATPEKLKLAGLGARDSLRLEAGMCLYGHDLDDTTTPVEAGLSWVIPPARRQNGGFHGSEVIIPQLTPKSKGGLGVERRRVGLVVEGAPAREGAEIHKNGRPVGTVTSGVPSPTLGKNIAMGYIKDGLQKAGTEVDVVVRGRSRKATVTKMPFVPTKYWKGLAPA